MNWPRTGSYDLGNMTARHVRQIDLREMSLKADKTEKLRIMRDEFEDKMAERSGPYSNLLDFPCNHL